MELSSSLTPFPKKLSEISFSSSLSSFPLQLRQKPSKPNNLLVFSVYVDPSQDLPRNSPQRLLKELVQRKKTTAPRKKVPPKRFILKRPLDDKKLTERFLNSPQLSLKQFPLLSYCLPSSKFNNADQTWIDEYLLEAKQALGYPLEKSEELGDNNPAKQFNTLLYLAFQHVLELALAEFFLQRYPRESPGPMRERVFGLIGKRNLPKWIKAASLQNLIFPYDDMDKLIRKEPPVR
ncbi:casein kinase II subunit alpha-1-like [Hibiscus syriacus]|uniref:Casein kinase II subunit alpha-1-like n=1 Tax=Hibiscus syriacus TaxID=106335 RepID=A0A6A2X8U6_HIBSY|nr:casein kinase II subunit alpha-1-like [Hibiscus syriacus]